MVLHDRFCLLACLRAIILVFMLAVLVDMNPVKDGFLLLLLRPISRVRLWLYVDTIIRHEGGEKWASGIKVLLLYQIVLQRKECLLPTTENIRCMINDSCDVPRLSSMLISCSTFLNLQKFTNTTNWAASTMQGNCSVMLCLYYVFRRSKHKSLIHDTTRGLNSLSLLSGAMFVAPHPALSLRLSD